ncbi:MAG: 4a-hydroxytetrahydrobiopterin dehydratase [Vicinamibacterales bacterium]
MKLSTEQIDARLRAVPGWKFEDKSLLRQYAFASFPDAIAFVTRLAFDAQAADHHPDLTIHFKRVTVRWSTHDQGGVTEKDFEGVRQADAVARQMDPTHASRPAD